jgi:hypothetical protein
MRFLFVIIFLIFSISEVLGHEVRISGKKSVMLGLNIHIYFFGIFRLNQDAQKMSSIPIVQLMVAKNNLIVIEDLKELGVIEDVLRYVFRVVSARKVI